MQVTRELMAKAGVDMAESGSQPGVWSICWYCDRDTVISDRVMLIGDKSYVEVYDGDGDGRWEQQHGTLRTQQSDSLLCDAAWSVFHNALESREERDRWQLAANGRMRELAARLYGFTPNELPDDIA